MVESEAVQDSAPLGLALISTFFFFFLTSSGFLQMQQGDLQAQGPAKILHLPQDGKMEMKKG